MDERSKIGEIEEKLDSIEEGVRESNGFLSRKGSLVDRKEVHGVVIGSSFMALAYILPSPLGEMMVLAFMLFLRSVFNAHRPDTEYDGQLGDAIQEFGYTLSSAAVTAFVFDQYTGYGLQRVDVASVVARLMLGA